MAALLRLLLLGALALFLFRFLQKALGLPAPTPRQDDGRNSDDAQVMRRCAYCNVHVPEGESTRSRGHYFCCEAHRDAFFQGKPH